MFFYYQSLNVYYEVKGSGSPVIFLHGWGSNLNTFIDTVDRLIPHYKVYALDFPSFGSSPSPKKALSIKEIEEMLEEFIKRLNIINPVIIAHSYGGRVAIEYAAKSSNLKALVLVDSAGIKEKGIIKKLKIIKYKLLKKYYKLTHKLMDYNNLLQKSGSPDYKNASSIQKGMLIKAVNYDQTKLLKKIKAPTLIMWGKSDNVTKVKNAKKMHRLIKSSGLVLIPEASHFSYLDNKYYFNLVLLNFLERIT